MAHETFRGKGKVEAVFSSNQGRRSRVYPNPTSTSNFRKQLKKEDRRLWWRRALQKPTTSSPFTFIMYYNQLR
jgi:hypothetical protein